MKRFALVLASTAMALAAPAFASTIVVTPGSPLFSSTDNSGGGSSVITGTAPHDGNGSLELRGDKTRFETQPYPGNFGLVSSFLGATFDYKIASDSSRQDYTPSFRIQIYDSAAASGSQLTDLVYEGVYNNFTNASTGHNEFADASSGLWVTTDLTSLLWQRTVGSTQPATFNGQGQQINQAFSDWKSTYSASAYIYGFTVGQGGGGTVGYHAFADDFTIYNASGSTTFNFEATDAATAVPEPAMLGLFGVGALGLGIARRRKA